MIIIAKNSQCVLEILIAKPSGFRDPNRQTHKPSGFRAHDGQTQWVLEIQIAKPSGFRDSGFLRS